MPGAGAGARAALLEAHRCSLGKQDLGWHCDCHGAMLHSDIFIKDCQGLQDLDLLSGPLAHDHVPKFMDSAYTFNKYLLKTPKNQALFTVLMKHSHGEKSD